jgi:hypothetical protein
MKNKKSIFKNLIGKYVICRTRNEGINCGFVVSLSKNGVVLSEARRLYYHKPKDLQTSWYEGVSVSGLSDDSKISCPVEKKIIIEDYSLTICSEISKQILIKAKSHDQK